MTPEELQAKFAVKFPGVEKAKAQVKNYLTLRLPDPGQLLPVISWLKDDLGFTSLHMVTAVDWLGELDLNGYIREPNFNVFLPEGATPQVTAPVKGAGVEYRGSIELVYSLQNFSEKLTVFLKVDIPRDNATVPSLVSTFKAADWQEREIYDLFGVRFTDHPNLKKILTPEFLVGHPLRKDYVHKKDRFDD